MITLLSFLVEYRSNAAVVHALERLPSPPSVILRTIFSQNYKVLREIGHLRPNNYFREKRFNNLRLFLFSRPTVPYPPKTENEKRNFFILRNLDGNKAFFLSF